MKLSIEKNIHEKFPLSNAHIWSNFCQRPQFAIYKKLSLDEHIETIWKKYKYFQYVYQN